ncbi:MAG: SpoIIE family protein phosphatase [Lachnospiraceae bacterium]|jgi:serine/threonine protein phosphatase PrpC|nr:SpoIIE family protein phosphatase [Lachnospiraceae bacterium]
MSIAEITVLAVMVLTFILIMIRCFGVREGRVIKRYQVGKAMTIGKRQVQEDYCGISRTTQGLLAVLADGMGRNYGGKIASKITVNTIETIFTAVNAFENPIYFFKRALYAANREILKELDEGHGGASVAVTVIQDDKLYYALVGNVKVAIYRDGCLVPLSNGHTFDVLAEAQYYRGELTREDAQGLLKSRRLYNYLGQDGFGDIEFFDTPVALESKDVVVIMTDGVFEGTTWREIEECVGHPKTCQARAAEIMELIHHANKKEQDNASIILIEQP